MGLFRVKFPVPVLAMRREGIDRSRKGKLPRLLHLWRGKWDFRKRKLEKWDLLTFSMIRLELNRQQSLLKLCSQLCRFINGNKTVCAVCKVENRNHEHAIVLVLRG